MPANLDDLGRELAALTQRFNDLSASLGEAARALEDAGAPPADGLVEALAGARDQFLDLRSQSLSAAGDAGVPGVGEPDSLRDLEPLLVATAEALAARARRERLERAQSLALAVLDRVLELAHRDDRAFPALVGCHASARQAREAMLALTEADSEAARQTITAVQPFADLLSLIDSREGVDEERYAELEESVSRAFGRPLAVAGARGRLAFAADIVDVPEPAPEAPEPAPLAAGWAADAPEEELVAAAASAEEPPPLELAAEPEADVDTHVPGPATIELPLLEPLDVETGPSAVSEPPASFPLGPGPSAVDTAAAAGPGAESTEPAAPDDTAQWWLAAWARWSGWKASQAFPDAVREELGKYPYLLSVPVQRSPEYEDGLLAYGYSILMDHVEKQNPGCVGHALNSLRVGHPKPVGEQLYEYLVREGRLGDTYPGFVHDVLMAALPEPGVWFQFRILETREDTRIFQRPSARIGDAELAGQRLANDGQRYAEHKFKMTLGPLTTRCVLLSVEVKEARSAGFKLLADNAASESAWIVTVPAVLPGHARPEARRIVTEGSHVTGLGKEQAAVWVAIFNAEPARDQRYQLSVILRKDSRSPFRGRN